jgi:hypothetical protein
LEIAFCEVTESYPVTRLYVVLVTTVGSAHDAHLPQLDSVINADKVNTVWQPNYKI